jgi:hypothetical protein
MTVLPLKVQQRAAAAVRREAPTHLFSVGQVVRYKGGFGRLAGPAELFRVTATLPVRGDSPQYRIRNDEERHERVSGQDDLEAVAVDTSETTLIERTFGLG